LNYGPQWANPTYPCIGYVLEHSADHPINRINVLLPCDVAGKLKPLKARSLIVKTVSPLAL
jgi:hypothetical protein